MTDPSTDRGFSQTPPVPVDAPETGAPKLGLIARAKLRSEVLKARAESTRNDLEARRGSNRVIDAAFGSIEHDSRIGAGLLAGAIAFRFFLLLVPYAFVMVYGFGFGADVTGENPQELARRSGITGLAASAMSAGADASMLTRIFTFSIALYALLSGATNMVKALRATHALIWRVPLAKLKRARLAGIKMIVVITAGFALTSLISRLRSHSFILWLVVEVLFIAFPAVIWLVASDRFFPSAEGTTWRDQVPGAVFIGVGLQVLHVVTIVWIARSIEAKSETYGAIGAALTLLLWAYLLGRLVTASATINSVVWANNHPDIPVDQPDPGALLSD